MSTREHAINMKELERAEVQAQFGIGAGNSAISYGLLGKNNPSNPMVDPKYQKT